MIYRRWMHRKERLLTLRDTNRRVFPFEWGLDWIGANGNSASDPARAFLRYSQEALEEGPAYFSAPPLREWRLEGEVLHFPTPTPGKDHFNNTVQCRYFPVAGARRAVVVVPQWNADRESHVTLCRILQRLGIAVLRLSLPYHEDRRPPGMQRADYMVSPNIGRTIHATRQAVLEVRQSAQWLRLQGYERVGVMGTSVGSCVTYLAFVHDPSIDVGVFNHVSATFADVVWTGLSTRFVRWGLENHIDLDTLRQCWAPISPYFHIPRLKGNQRPHLLITALYDLTFLPELSERVFDAYRKLEIFHHRTNLPCGHYTTASFPFSWMDGWHICRYLRRRLA